jgi:hypothetical protein
VVENSPQNRWHNLAFRELPWTLYSLLAIATAAVYFFSWFDLAFLLHGKLWSLGHADLGVNYLGFRYFVRDHWRFPLFYTPHLGYPDGTSIILSDSVPLLALVCKILRSVIPTDFDPMGLWILLCYLLLAHAFSALLYHFGHRGAIAAVAGALFAVMAPFLSVFFFAASLQAQFLIVYGLLLYFHAADGIRPRRTMSLFTLLLLAALLINFYFFAMVSILYLCAVANLLLKSEEEPSGLRALLGINGGITAAAVLATMFVAGYLPSPVPWTGASSYGYFSMNILAPVIAARPGGNGFFMNLSMQPDPTGGQTASFNYWGAGILLLLVVSAPVWLRRIGALFRPRFLPLTITLLLTTLFAISNRVYFGSHLILSYELPGPLLNLANMFHSSGRLFWAVSYCVMALAISQTLGMRQRWLSAALVVVALAAQMADTHAIHQGQQGLTRNISTQTITDAAWRPIVAAHQLVALVPPSQCLGLLDFYSEIGRVAAFADVAMHSDRPGRFGPSAPESCRVLLREISENGFSPGVLYIFEKAPFQSIRARPELARYCTELEGYPVCTLLHDELRLPPVAPRDGPPEWQSMAGPLTMQEISPLLGIGWSGVEADHVWSIGFRSEIWFRLQRCSDAKAIRVRIYPQIGPTGQTIHASANGGPAVTRSYPEGQVDDLTVPIQSCDPAKPEVLLALETERPISPLELQQGDDTRPLGFSLQQAELLR